jgi:hypothetical protein
LREECEATPDFLPDDLAQERADFEDELRRQLIHIQSADQLDRIKNTDKLRFDQVAWEYTICAIPYQARVGVKSIALAVDYNMTDMNICEFLSVDVYICLNNRPFMAMTLASALLRASVAGHIFNFESDHFEIPLFNFEHPIDDTAYGMKYGIPTKSNITVQFHAKCCYTWNKCISLYVVFANIPEDTIGFEIEQGFPYFASCKLAKCTKCPQLIVAYVDSDVPVESFILQTGNAAPWIFPASDCNTVDFFGIRIYCLALHPNFRAWENIVRCFQNPAKYIMDRKCFFREMCISIDNSCLVHADGVCFKFAATANGVTRTF